MNRLFSLCLVSIMAAITTPACGARFPNAVERSFTLSGAPAAAAAAFLGVTERGTFRLGRGEAWAIYLLKQDTPEPLYNDNDGSPPRDNVVAFTAGPVPVLTLGPYWLDQGTRLPNPEPGAFSFGSPFLIEATDGGGPWAALLRRAQAEADWRPGAQPEFRRCFGPAAGGELCVTIYQIKDYVNNVEQAGHIIGLTLHPG